MTDFNRNATHKTLTVFASADKAQRGAADKYATALGKELARLGVTEKKGADYLEATKQFGELWSKANGKLGLYRAFENKGKEAGDDAIKWRAAWAKRWQLVSSAALAGTTVEAQQYRNKPATAKGANDNKSGGATTSAVNEANAGDKATDQPSGKVGNVEMLTGAVERLTQVKREADKGETFTPKQIAALCTDIIRRIETASNVQMSVD